MLIGDNYIFIQVPRTSSSSTTDALIHQCGALETNIHGSFQDMEVDIDGKYVFGFVRNPFVREISQWKYHSTKKDDVFTEISFKDWVLWRYKDVPLPKEIFSPRDNYSVYEYLRTFSRYPQLGWFLDLEGNPLYTSIGFFEQREKHIQSIYSDLKLEIPEFHRLEQTHDRKAIESYKSFYDEETKQIIEERYLPDLQAFGYSFDKLEGQGYVTLDKVTNLSFLGKVDSYLHK